jgi:hypothetical protein
MENMKDHPAAEEASAALHQAEASRSALAARLEVPPASLGLLGLAVAAQIALTALGLGQDHGQAVDHVWLVGVGAAGAGGAAYALSGLHWMRTYRARPDRHARGEPALLLATIVAVAIVGLVALILGH